METGHFEWDDNKADSVMRDRGISFWDACGVFDDPDALTVPANDSWNELRDWTIGRVDGVLLTVTHTDGDDGRIRLITVWRSDKDEMDAYAAQWPAP